MREQCQPRAEQAQLEVLAQKISLRRRQQRYVRTIHILDAHQVAQVAPQLAREAHPRIAVRIGRAFLCGSRLGRPHFHRERQAVDDVDQIIEARADAYHVHVRRKLEPLDVARDHLAQPRELRPVKTREPRIGGLQRDQRRLDVARNLQLLVGDEQRLLDVGEQRLIAAARQFLIQCCERDLLVLRFGELGFEHAELDLRFTCRLAHLLGDATALLVLHVGGGKAPCELLLQRVDLLVAVVPLPREQRDGDHRDYRGRLPEPWPRGAAQRRRRFDRLRFEL